uniref:MADF domain-containing protein n=1 Tax=Photinus pyralis TaxID=7054 RepID=A0A1Y1KAI6_PHOPY
MSEIEWSREKTLQLINMYETKSELWDVKNSNYHLRNKKHDAWKNIATEMESDVEVIKAKVASLLSSMRREKAKMKNSTGTGKGRNEIYISKWFAFEAFKFLWDKDSVKGSINTETVSSDYIYFQPTYIVAFT